METCITYSYEWRTLKVFLATVNDFNWQFFLVRNHSGRHFSKSRRPEVFLGKGAPKICSKFTGEHPCRSMISIKLLSRPEVFLGKGILKKWRKFLGEHPCRVISIKLLRNLNFKPPSTLKILSPWEVIPNNFVINSCLWWKFNCLPPTNIKYF